VVSRVKPAKSLIMADVRVLRFGNWSTVPEPAASLIAVARAATRLGIR